MGTGPGHDSQDLEISAGGPVPAAIFSQTLTVRQRLRRAITRFVQAEEGPTAVEYAFLAFLVIVACVVAIVSLGQNTNSLQSNNAARITGAAGD